MAEVFSGRNLTLAVPTAFQELRDVRMAACGSLPLENTMTGLPDALLCRPGTILSFIRN